LSCLDFWGVGYYSRTNRFGNVIDFRTPADGFQFLQSIKAGVLMGLCNLKYCRIYLERLRGIPGGPAARLKDQGQLQDARG
jgi:hypothetical protein